jgi:hypothetical protein
MSDWGKDGRIIADALLPDRARAKPICDHVVGKGHPVRFFSRIDVSFRLFDRQALLVRSVQGQFTRLPLC